MKARQDLGTALLLRVPSRRETTDSRGIYLLRFQAKLRKLTADSGSDAMFACSTNGLLTRRTITLMAALISTSMLAFRQGLSTGQLTLHMMMIMSVFADSCALMTAVQIFVADGIANQWLWVATDALLLVQAGKDLESKTEGASGNLTTASESSNMPTFEGLIPFHMVTGATVNPASLSAFMPTRK